MLYGGVEGGGTKFVCAVSDESGQIITRDRFPTGEPGATITQAIQFFKDFETQRGESIAALGIASFGPVDLNPASDRYGYITSTPKMRWASTDLIGPFKRAFPGVPIGFDTDVNGAALGEHRWGAAREWDTFVYLTVGTGIGGGAMVGGQLAHGLIHPEMGHILLPIHPDDPLERGVCPFHPNCLEGLAAGPSLQARWNAPGETLPSDHPAWPIEAFYLAQALVAMFCILSPQGIILGGSVMHQPQLFALVRKQTQTLLNGYLAHPCIDNLDQTLVPPGLGDNAGVLGAIALAMAAYGGR
jgi:fructokinase